MYRVLRILNRLNLGGPTYNAAYLSRYLEPEFSTWLAAGRKKETEASSSHILERNKVTPVYLPHMSRSVHPLHDWKAYSSIVSLIRQIRPHIVHTHAAKAGALGRLAAYRTGVPVIIHTFHGHVFHSYFGPLKSNVFLAIERYLADQSSCVIALSELQRKELVERYRLTKSQKVRTIPLGFDLSKFQKNRGQKRNRFRQQYQMRPDEVAIGIVGRLVPVKNHGFFLVVMQQLLQQFSHIRAFIIGDGQEKKALQEKATELSIPWSETSMSDNPKERYPLTFTSWMTDIDTAMAGLDIVALTSLNEGTPVSLIEAQAAGKPVVTTNVGGVKDVVTPHQGGFLTSPSDTRSFVHYMARLIRSPQLRQKMGKSGQRKVPRQFHYQRLVYDTRSLYRQLLAREGVTPKYS